MSIGLDPAAAPGPPPHLLGPGLGAEEADPQLDRVEADLHLADDVVDIEREGGRAGDDRAAEILQEQDLLLRVAAGDRDDRGAHPLGAVVSAQAAGEQAVAVGVLDHVLVRRPGAGEGARHDLGPEVDVVAVIGDDGGLSGRARGSMDADDVVERLGEQAVGIIVAEVGFLRKGKFYDVLDALDVGRLHAIARRTSSCKRERGRIRARRPSAAVRSAVSTVPVATAILRDSRPWLAPR